MAECVLVKRMIGMEETSCVFHPQLSYLFLYVYHLLAFRLLENHPVLSVFIAGCRRAAAHSSSTPYVDTCNVIIRLSISFKGQLRSVPAPVSSPATGLVHFQSESGPCG